VRERWIGKKVDLKILSQKILEFLRNKNFEVNELESSREVVLVGVSRDNARKKVKICITGCPDDFVVDFKSPIDDFLKISTQLLTFFGLGFLVYRRVKEFDYYQSLEEDFWAFLVKAVTDLAGSAS